MAPIAHCPTSTCRRSVIRRYGAKRPHTSPHDRNTQPASFEVFGADISIDVHAVVSMQWVLISPKRPARKDRPVTGISPFSKKQRLHGIGKIFRPYLACETIAKSLTTCFVDFVQGYTPFTTYLRDPDPPVIPFQIKNAPNAQIASPTGTWYPWKSKYTLYTGL